jgi:glyoxylase-like metal-dependent hydrolase (beta-lactamase superfamily II)
MHKLVAALVLLCACTGAQKPPEVTAAPAAPVVHAYTSGEGGIFVNAWLVEGERGIVAVDATLTVSDASALKTRVEQLDKPLLAVLLTHGHPDHYNGAGILADEPVPVLATAEVDRIIRRDDASKEAQWKPMFGEQWPSPRRFPSQIVADGEQVTFDTLTFRVHELGPGESHHDTWWELEGPEPAAFVGDAVFQGMHGYTSDGHTREWLDNLDRLSAQLGEIDKLYPGHGQPGGRELLGAQRAWIERYREVVGGLGAPPLDEAAKATLSAEMQRYLGTDKLLFLVGLGADAVAAELAGQHAGH